MWLSYPFLFTLGKLVWPLIRAGEPEPVGAGCFWLLGAGAAWKKSRSWSRLEKSQEPHLIHWWHASMTTEWPLVTFSCPILTSKVYATKLHFFMHIKRKLITQAIHTQVRNPGTSFKWDTRALCGPMSESVSHWVCESVSRPRLDV